MATKTKIPYQYMAFGKSVCRYPSMNCEGRYSVGGDILIDGQWRKNNITIELKLNEIDDYTTHDLCAIIQYCEKNGIKPPIDTL